MNEKRKQRNQRGRPKNSQKNRDDLINHKINNEEIKQYWTEHRITLIAYEAQYMYNKRLLSITVQQQNQKQQLKQDQKQQSNSQKDIYTSKQSIKIHKNEQIQIQKTQFDNISTKRKGRKKVNPLFETGFLFYSNSQQKNQYKEQIPLKQIIKDYKALQGLFSQNLTDPNDIETREFIKIMLQLKNHELVHQFAAIYDLIYRQISKISFQQVQKQQQRKQIVKEIENKLVDLINARKQKFKFFQEYLTTDHQETLKLLYVQAYCFLAERLNFNINEFYADAFSLTLTDRSQKQEGRKKIKTQ